MAMSGRREKITNRTIKILKPGELVWDSIVTGFGVRRQKSEAVSYVLIYRTQEGRQRCWRARWSPISSLCAEISSLGCF